MRLKSKNIMIMGCSGSGKSTLTSNLTALSGLRAIHMDRLFFTKDWIKRDDALLTKLVEEEILQDGWIFDGNHSASYDIRLEKADMIIWLDIPRWRCFVNLFTRLFKYWGKVRPHIAEGCTETMDLDFFFFVWGFKNRGNKKIERLCSDNQGKIEIHHLTHYKAIAEFTENFKKQQQSRP